MEGDEDEEDIDDLEHEFNIEDVHKNTHSHIAEAMLHGKMSYGRGPDDDDRNSQLPPVIAGIRSRPVRIITKIKKKKNSLIHIVLFTHIHTYQAEMIESSNFVVPDFLLFFFFFLMFHGNDSICAAC